MTRYVQPRMGAPARRCGRWRLAAEVEAAAADSPGQDRAEAAVLQYYRCDFVGGVVSNCAALATGTVEIKTAGSARALEFMGYPDSPVGTVRSYGEFGGAVYVARRTKSASQFNLYSARRLNGVAWEAMKPQLGLGGN